MSRKAYNYNFKMFMEGIEVPFQSANIVCSPNGVEASINCHSNEQLLELKPKTAIQIFYQDWFGNSTPEWHLMFDGFYSRIDKNEDAVGGVGIAIQARDFRMDIRKAPAALSYNTSQDISGSTYYHTSGVFRNITYKTNYGTFQVQTPTFDDSHLGDLADVIVRISKGAQLGLALEHGQVRKTDLADCTGALVNALPQAVSKDPKKQPNIMGNADGGFFLDAFVRGIWLEAAGGTKLGTFLNKRIRTDKRFMVPVNASGFQMWKVNNLGQLGGECATADSQFTSIEAIIMRIAGMFMVRPYACNTPSFISLADNSPAWSYVIDNDVRTFVTKICSDEFGAPYMLNESMLLPPLEFTAPPDCNLIFPPMYNRVIWQYDIDSEITRGYYTMTDCFSTEGTGLLQKWGYQVPNALFNMPKTNADGTQHNESNNEWKSSRMTLEERYKGVNVTVGVVESQVALREVNTVLHKLNMKIAAAAKISANIAKQKAKVKEANSTSSTSKTMKKKASISLAAMTELAQSQEATQALNEALIKDKDGQGNASKEPCALALKHHALLKFINTRYQGRVVTVEMTFNPYIICGFPSIVLADDHGDGIQTLKNMIGQVQQVKHFISRDGEAATSCVLNNVRMIDEPSDMNEQGNPLYCKATDTKLAALNNDLTYYSENSVGPGHVPYFIGNGHSPVKSTFVESKYFDLTMDDNKLLVDYKYAKDFLGISKNDKDNGKINGIYLDDIYSPNRITRFYAALFGQKNNFMVGNAIGNDYKFMFDTIHEAVEKNLLSRTDLLSDLESGMMYIKRNVCREEEFFLGILGLSIPQIDNNGDVTYINKTGLHFNDYFDNTATHSEYYGVSTAVWDNPKFHKELRATINQPGCCSSITESSPMTAFIEERKDAVRAYLKSVLQQVEAVSFTS